MTGTFTPSLQVPRHHATALQTGRCHEVDDSCLLSPPVLTMSSTQGSGEHWKSWSRVGISRKELAMAEALQMEYDALSRFGTTRRKAGQSRTRPSLISWDEPVLDVYSKPAGRRKDLCCYARSFWPRSYPQLQLSLPTGRGLSNHSTSRGSQPGPDPWPKGSWSRLSTFLMVQMGALLSPGPRHREDSS